MAVVAILRLTPGVLIRASNQHQLAGRLVGLAHQHGHPFDLADHPDLVEAAVHPADRPTDVLDRLAGAGRTAFTWLADNAVPAGWQLLLTAAGVDHLLALASTTPAGQPATEPTSTPC